MRGKSKIKKRSKDVFISVFVSGGHVVPNSGQAFAASPSVL